MQDVSYEPLILCPSENPQASLDIFSQPHHHPIGSCINRKAINKDKHLSSGFCPTTDRTPRALWCLEGSHITSTLQALWCLEGTTK